MKYIGLIIGLWISCTGYSQDFYKIDKYTRQVPRSTAQNITTLTNYLEEPYQDDVEKIRSFYSWLITHIKYDNQIYKKEVKYLDQTIETILRKRKAVCWGYSKMFEKMCQIANIPCETVVGYSKKLPSGKINWKQEDHAWNVVKVDSIWHVLDITWASGTQYQPDYLIQKYQTNYFFTPPHLFILNHLPSDPMWQLLNCPITNEEFKKSTDAIQQLANRSERFFNFKDSLIRYLALPYFERKLKKHLNIYHYNPSKYNAREVLQCYLEQVETLRLQTEKFKAKEQFDTLQITQKEMLILYEKGAKYAPFFDNEKENWARTLLNYAVGSIQLAEANNSKDNTQLILIYRKAIQDIQKAQKLLILLPNNNIITEQALEQCKQMLAFAEYNLEIYKAKK